MTTFQTYNHDKKITSQIDNLDKTTSQTIHCTSIFTVKVWNILTKTSCERQEAHLTTTVVLPPDTTTSAARPLCH